jgi:hypothetical protein
MEIFLGKCNLSKPTVAVVGSQTISTNGLEKTVQKHNP